MLVEDTANDLFRKISALTAVINDAAATDGEKANARSLRTQLEDRLKAEFPNVQPPLPNAQSAMQSNQRDDFDNSWFGQMAKAAADDVDRRKRWKENPGAEQEHWASELQRLKRSRTSFYKTMIPGDVYNAEQMAEYNRRIDNILRTHFPEEWQRELDKREAKRNAGYKYQDKKRKERDTELKNKAHGQKTSAGLGTMKEIGKEFEEPLKAFHTLLKGLRYPKYPTSSVEGFKSGAKTLYNINELASGDLRRKWSELDQETQQLVVAAVSKVNTLGYKANGYTDAQKKRILDALRPSKAQPSKYDNPDKYQDMLAKRAERRRYR